MSLMNIELEVIFFATQKNNSVFIGNEDTVVSTNANNSNFFGIDSGLNATSAAYSNLFGYKAGAFFTDSGITNNISSNNIIIGTNISLTNLTGSFPVTSGQTLSGYHSIITDGQPSTTISGQGVIDYLIEINGLVVSSGSTEIPVGLGLGTGLPLDITDILVITII